MADFAAFESEANSPPGLERVLSTPNGERSSLLKFLRTLYLAYVESAFPVGRPSSESIRLSNRQVRFIWRIVTFRLICIKFRSADACSRRRKAVHRCENPHDIAEARSVLRNEA